MSNLRVWVRSTLATVATEASYARMETEAWLAQGLQLAIVVLLVAGLYFTILVNLGRQWATDPDFSHGFFVPLFSAFVVWQKRAQLARISLRPSWVGLLMIAGALLTLIVGLLGAELFLSRSSFILL